LPIVGCSSPEEVAALAAVAARAPLSAGERRELAGIFQPYAARMAFYRGVK
jgi:hypothetical protein